ncbi:MAG TPA: AAA family ATPase [Alphaproteobacteria bacterium]|nr:AAA family ATPase [Alphaproteobacteria bacterium]
MPDIASWLARLGLEKYIEAFTANEIDYDALRHLTDEDLKELGLPIGPRRKIMAAISALDREPVVTAGPAAVPPVPRRGEAERRQLTVIFIDLVGSTELSRRLDPEEMRGVIRAYHDAVSAQIARYDGHVAKLMGDGVLAYFGWPQAHEDDAERAVLAGLGATAATAMLTTPRGEPLAARAGVATGLVVVGDLIGEGSAREETVVGETPNLASRLQALAAPSTVVVADSTRRLIAGLFDMIDLGSQELKGYATPLRAWKITGETGVEDRFDARHGALTPFVGRAVELDLLLQRWRQARVGTGQAVLLSGEPGIGKSRLIAALLDRLSSEPHARLRYSCSSLHMNSALHPAIRQLEMAAGLGRNDSAQAKLDKLEGLLRQAVSDTAEIGPFLAALLSIDTTERYAPSSLTPQAQKARTLAALIRQIEGLASRQPVMVLVEDAHWIDPTTSEWLGLLIDRLESLRVLLIVTFRPEFQPRWTLFSNVTALSLSRLGRDQGSAIIDHVAGGKTLPPEVKSEILAKTEGVPLFVEELTKTVLESGSLLDKGDHYALPGPLPALTTPSTLQDSLMARLDRLGSAKEVAQTGACIGRVFHYRLLTAVTGSDEVWLEEALRQLESSELVFRRGVPPEATYTFKHALVQETAYQSLLKSRRQQIHASITSTLESQFPEIAETEPETLAHHYTAAGLEEQAVSYWLKAGQQAIRRSANFEAMAHLGKGLELIAALPQGESRLRQEINLQTALGVTIMVTRGWGAPEGLQAYSKARMLSEALGDKNQLFVAIRGEATYHMISGNLSAAAALGHQCLELAHVYNDPNLLLEAHHQLWATKYYAGDYAAAEAHIDIGLAIYDPEQHHRLTYIYTGHDPGICCKNFSADLLWLRGYPDQAVKRAQESVTLAERLSHPLTQIQALSTIGQIQLLRGEAEQARNTVEKCGALSKEFVLKQMISQAQFHLGWALTEQGRMEEGLREMREGVVATLATGAKYIMQTYLGVLAQACGEGGDVSEGLAVLERAFGMVAESGSKHQQSELLRVKGDLLLRLDPHGEAAESWLRQALAVACEQRAKSLELRAAISLARLCRARGRNEEAREVLYPVYNWFTEGLETRDLVNARELLSQLR